MNKAGLESKAPPEDTQNNMANSLSYFSAIGILLAYAFYALGPSVHRSLTVLGALRGEVPHTLDVEEIIVIPDTTHCEDVHYYAPGASLFAACEDNANTRFRWFPPLAVFDDPELGKRGRGSIHVISPKVCDHRPQHVTAVY